MSLLLYILVPIVIFALIILYLAFFGTAQNEVKTQESDMLFAKFGYEVVEDYKKESQNALALLKAHNSTIVQINRLYQNSQNSEVKLFLVEFGYESSSGEDEIVLAFNTKQKYPESLIISMPILEGFMGKIFDFAIDQLQVKHLQPLVLPNETLQARYKINSTSKILFSYLTANKLETLMSLGHFSLNLKDDLILIRLLHIQGGSTKEQDIQKLLDIKEQLMSQ